MGIVSGGANDAPVQVVTVTIQRRTIRRRQRKDIIADLTADMETIDKLRESAKDPLESKAYENLYIIVSGAYNDLIDSEV